MNENIKGMYAEAVAEYLNAADFEFDGPRTAAVLKQAYSASGMNGFWWKDLELMKQKSKRRYVPPFRIARLYARLFEKDKAFEWIQKAYEERSPYLLNLKLWPEFDSLRSDPRFSDLMRRVGLAN